MFEPIPLGLFVISFFSFWYEWSTHLHTLPLKITPTPQKKKLNNSPFLKREFCSYAHFPDAMYLFIFQRGCAIIHFFVVIDLANCWYIYWCNVPCSCTLPVSGLTNILLKYDFLLEWWAQIAQKFDGLLTLKRTLCNFW